jgi:hypothetical protein
MGLDIVEMVIELEKEFAIDLPDGELRLAETVGDLVALVATRSGLAASASEAPFVDGCARIASLFVALAMRQQPNESLQPTSAGTR